MAGVRDESEQHVSQRRLANIFAWLLLIAAALVVAGYFVATRPRLQRDGYSDFRFRYEAPAVNSADAQRLQQFMDSGDFLVEYTRRLDTGGATQLAAEVRRDGFETLKIVPLSSGSGASDYSVRCRMPSLRWVRFDPFSWRNVAPVDEVTEGNEALQWVIFRELVDEILRGP